MDQQFSLSWNNFHGNLSKGFAGLLGNGEFVDVTIAVEGHLLQAHKVILSICSPYFKKMFQLNPCQHPIVVLRDVTYKAMRDLLQFMYHGEVSVKREDLTSFIGTAEVLQIKGLTNKETEEEVLDTEKDTKQSIVTHNDSPDAESYTSDIYDSNVNEISDNSEDLIKKRHLLEKLQRLTNLKRKSDEFLQKNYYSDTILEKRTKVTDKKPYKINDSVQSGYDMYEKHPIEITTINPVQKICSNDNVKDKQTDTQIELKTECDESDITVIDPAVCSTQAKALTIPLEYQSPQENCTSLSTLFMDLKNLVNGKINTTSKDYQRHPLEHRLITIPQKEDGKKKYPQRSCRLCWRLGKRRDTRFMCSACELPFCKTPCFEIHFNDTFKSQHMQDYYST